MTYPHVIVAVYTTLHIYRGAATGGGDVEDMSPTLKSRRTSYVLVPPPLLQHLC